MEAQALPALRPLRLGELLDQAIRIYRRNFVTLIGIVALVYIPLTILQTASTALTTTVRANALEFGSPSQLISNPAYWIGILASFVIIFLQVIFVQGIATGAVTRAVTDSYFGRKTSILDAYRGIGNSWLPLVGALLFVGLLIIIGFLWWIIVPCVGWFTGLGMLVFILWAISPLVAPVVVLERRSSLDAVRRVWLLARRRFWPILLYIFILFLFNLLIVYGPTLIASVILTSVFSSVGDMTTQLVLTSIVQAIVSIVFLLIYYPLQMTAFTLIYFDLRVRTEGFDLALLASGDAEQALTASVPQAKESLITGTDLGNFAILTFAAAGICIFTYSIMIGFVFFMASLFN